MSRSFAQYVDAVEGGAALPVDFRTRSGADATAYEVLRRYSHIDELRRKGSFFTGADLAKRMWAPLLKTLTNGSRIVDPACGAGDLLLPAVAYVNENQISNVAFGLADVDASFIRVAQAHLNRVISAGSSHVDAVERDFLVDASMVSDATHVVLNPPFVALQLDEDWAKGATNAAALFIIKALSYMAPGAHIAAILPDVLRSGSRYSRWREVVESLATDLDIQTDNLFDSQTDVHVFILHAKAGKGSKGSSWGQEPSTGSTISDYCEVRVGPVVPHRDVEAGELVDYVTARSLSAGAKDQRRFKGRLELGPMVLVNRTSRPGDVPRVRARVRMASAPVAVENHLLIVKPKNPDDVSCELLMQVLTSDAVTSFLEAKIRCRHLTVSSIKDIPWPI
jgi:hypothetical protein